MKVSIIVLSFVALAAAGGYDGGNNYAKNAYGQTSSYGQGGAGYSGGSGYQKPQQAVKYSTGNAYGSGYEQSYDNSYADNYAPAEYQYAYRVLDYPYYAPVVDFGAQEQRYGDYTSGEYDLVQPDGLRRVVKYTVNGKSGFVADVSYVPADGYSSNGYSGASSASYTAPSSYAAPSSSYTAPASYAPKPKTYGKANY